MIQLRLAPCPSPCVSFSNVNPAGLGVSRTPGSSPCLPSTRSSQHLSQGCLWGFIFLSAAALCLAYWPLALNMCSSASSGCLEGRPQARLQVLFSTDPSFTGSRGSLTGQGKDAAPVGPRAAHQPNGVYPPALRSNRICFAPLWARSGPSTFCFLPVSPFRSRNGHPGLSQHCVVETHTLFGVTGSQLGRNSVSG